MKWLSKSLALARSPRNGWRTFWGIVVLFLGVVSVLATLPAPHFAFQIATFFNHRIVAADGHRVIVEKTLADIDGDGDLDAVIGREYSTVAAIQWYENPSSPTASWTPHDITATGQAYEDMLGADVDNDGDVDIIASYNSTVVWFSNPRIPGGSTWTQNFIGNSAGENTMEFADLDNDGKKDLVTNTYVFFQNSPTSWTPVAYYNHSPYLANYRGVALLDIGHGRINIVTAGSPPNPDITWYENPRENTPTGNARTGTWIPHHIGAGYLCGPNNSCPQPDVANYGTGDLNGDASMDVVSVQAEGDFAPPPGGMIWWQAPSDRRNGTWIKHTIDANFVSAHNVKLGDMNGDGKLDIVSAEQDQARNSNGNQPPQGRVSIFFNNGSGVFTRLDLANMSGHNVAIGDIEPDGDLDVLSSRHGFWASDSTPIPIDIFVQGDPDDFPVFP